MTNEEMALAIQQGDKSLVEPLWKQLHGLIEMQVRQYFTLKKGLCVAAGVAEEDLIQTGFFAMLDAVRAYNPKRGYKLTAFMHYPMQRRFNALLWKGTIGARRDLLNGCDSLDEPLCGEDIDFTRAGALSDEKAQQAFEDIIESEWCRGLRAVEDEMIDKRLSEREAVVVRGTFFDSLTLESLANQFGVTCEWVRQLREKGLRKLRTGESLRRLRPFLDDEDGALGLRGTGLSAFRTGGSATERAVEVLERIERY